MRDSLRVAYIAHSLRSDWNNGNAHFLRGLMRALVGLGHAVTIFEPETGWSIDNLRSEARAEASLAGFRNAYPELAIQTFADTLSFADTRSFADTLSSEAWHERLRGADIVILHEWNLPELAQLLLGLRDGLGFKLLFHDTHHRASSSPGQIERFGLKRFDGVLAFGEVLRTIYRERFGILPVWTLHEAADTSAFKPQPDLPVDDDVVWIGNWGEGERAEELREFLVRPAARIDSLRCKVYGVRYPQEGLEALEQAGIVYGGYLPNLNAPDVYARARMTLHIPRQQYSSAMPGIPTIRVFEALACGIPLLSAPWDDCEGLFRAGDFRLVRDADEMIEAIEDLLDHPDQAEAQAARGLETVLARHTCAHRAQELTAICEELIQ